MKIIISHVYSIDNKGDAALLDVLINEIKQQFKPTKITILTMDKIEDGELFSGVVMKHSFLYFIKAKRSNRPWWLLYGTAMMSYSLLIARLQGKFGVRLPITSQWREIIELYADSDLVITVGGGYLRTTPAMGSAYDFSQLLHPIILAKNLRKPTILYTQSIGPLFRNIHNSMLKQTLNSSVLLTIAREDKSLQLLRGVGIERVSRSVDAGFLLANDKKIVRNTKLPKLKGRLTLGVTARNWLDEAEQSAYELAIAKAADYMIESHNAYVVFIPQVTAEFHDDDDRIPSRRIYGKMVHKQYANVLNKNYDHMQIKALYSQLDLLLGTRFHSVIFSLTSLVPALAIEYEHKTSGIMNDLGLAEWVVKMEDVTYETLRTKMDALVKNRKSYHDHIQEVLPNYIDRAHDAIVMADRAYRKVK